LKVEIHSWLLFKGFPAIIVLITLVWSLLVLIACLLIATAAYVGLPAAPDSIAWLKADELCCTVWPC